MPVVSYNSWAGLALEIAWGTAAAAPLVYVPFKTLKSEDAIKKILDAGKRGSLAKDFANYSGVMTGKVDLDMNVYPDLVGYFLKAIMGQVTTTGTGTYTHSFKLANSQPPSLSIFDYDGVGERVYAGSVLSELGFKFTSEGDLSMSAKMESKASSVVGTTHTPTLGTAPMFIGYQADIKIAGAANTRVIGGDLAFKRATKMTFGANNSQAPSKATVGTLEVTGKVDFEIDDYTELNYYLQTTQPAVEVSFTSGTNVLTFKLGKADFEKIGGIDRSQEVARVSATIRGLYNTTDAGPAQIELKNSQASY